MILLFIGGAAFGACCGFFILGIASAARCADCRDKKDRDEMDRWKEEDQWP